jgi:hypothetical protein
MNDPLDVVRQITPPVEASPELLERVRNDLMTTITQSDDQDHHEHQEPDHQATPRPLRRRRRWVAPVAAAAVLTTAAAGWAALRGDSTTNTTLSCPTPDDQTAIVQAVTGDPVVDCAADWRRAYDTEPPPMVAYDDGNGAVAVLPEGEAPPDGYVALDPGPHQDTTVIELTAALADVGTGMASGCFDEAAARDVVQRELSRLGLSDWTITVDGARPPTGPASCADALVRAEQRQVQLIGTGPRPAEPNPYTAFGAELEQRLSAECLGLDAAADLTRSVAAATEIVINGHPIDLSEESGVLVLSQVPDPGAECSRADVVVGGSVEVTLRGPA